MRGGGAKGKAHVLTCKTNLLRILSVTWWMTCALREPAVSISLTQTGNCCSMERHECEQRAYCLKFTQFYHNTSRRQPGIGQAIQKQIIVLPAKWVASVDIPLVSHTGTLLSSVGSVDIRPNAWGVVKRVLKSLEFKKCHIQTHSPL